MNLIRLHNFFDGGGIVLLRADLIYSVYETSAGPTNVNVLLPGGSKTEGYPVKESADEIQELASSTAINYKARIIREYESVFTPDDQVKEPS